MSLSRWTDVLSKDARFIREYRSVKIRDTKPNESGRSADVVRREVIVKFIRDHDLPMCSMMQRIQLQQYFDKLLNLCPYGLRSPEEMSNDQVREELETDRKICKGLESKQFIQKAIQQSEEQDMSKNASVPVIETKTFIYGVEAADMTDEQIFDHIREIEAKIMGYEQIVHKPQKLIKKIDTMTQAIVELVSFVDGREA